MHRSILQARVSRELKPGKSSKSEKSTKGARRQALIGDCSQLANTSFEVETEYLLDSNIAYTYPCSGSYLRYFGSNFNLLADVREAINAKGRELGMDVDCANLCDIDNDSFDTDTKSGAGDLFDLENSDILCDPITGVLNDPNQVRNDDFDNPNGNACECDPERGYVAGCALCFGTVSFKVNTCLDSSAFL